MSGADSTVEQKEKYRPQVLAKCVCTPGTEQVCLDHFREASLGDAPRGLWPSECSVRLMSFETFWVAMVATITAPWNYKLIRFFIGCAGATFVTNQFGCSLTLAPSVVGTANAIAAG